MTQLEKVYLLNVLLYIDEVHSTRNFLEINKKCREVGMMLRFYKSKKSNDKTECMTLVNKYPFIQKDIYDLFPTVETIECDYEDVFNGRKDSILKKAKKLRVIYE